VQWYKRLASDSAEKVPHTPSGQAPPSSRGSGDGKLVVEPLKGRRETSGFKVYLKVDMEGISGVVSREQVQPGTAEYASARRLLMQDLNAVLEGAFSARCTEAVVYDAHSAGRNVDLDSFDRRASVISGKPQPKDNFFWGLDDSYRALFLVGFHARAGAPDALMPHTYDDDIASVRVNGAEVGEIGMEAALAGKFGIPLVFISGDSGAVREAKDLLGDDVQAVEVKKAITATSAVCLPSARTADLLREGAVRAVRNASAVPPVIFQSPTTLEVTFHTAESAAVLEKLPGIQRTGESTVRVEGPHILAAYRDFVIGRSLNGKP